LGTIRDIIGSENTHLVYDAFGNLTSGTNPLLFGYTGKAFDTATNLQNNINRWYDATVGRWLSTDPIGFDGNDTNLYRYVSCRPINMFDPQGLEENVVTTTTVGGALGEYVTIEGRVGVRIQGTDFFITGNSKGTYGVPSTGSTSVLFIVKKNEPKKMYRLDYDIIKKGPNQGTKGWEHNQRGVVKILNLNVENHQPAEFKGKLAGHTITVFKWGGRGMFAVGAISSVVDIYKAQNKPREIVSQISGWVGASSGAWLGAKGGAAGGAAIGVWFGGSGAAPGAVIGSFAGGIVGGIGGYWVGHTITSTVWDWIFTPLEKEEYWIVECKE